jgi:hypothetical protein
MGTGIRAHQVPGDDFAASESLKRQRDEEVQAIADEAYRGAERLLADHRDLLDQIAERLLENEVIERAEIQSIVHGDTPEADRLEFDPRELAGRPAEALVTEPPADTEDA